MRSIKIKGLLIIFLTFLMVAISGCATAKKNPWEQKRKKASHVNTTQLGRNRYYFSIGYQKKLQQSVKRRR